ncbi:hypothetical protein MTR67_044275 [Solanum verrucosum]|uniref:Uncharacterized protein n=1 Tax=Solanum verrucosum TaxID=315347 RepID=A0AAF0UQL0_SOLVR|nr:hypothetical protein MTR67_044275 [Solanum verrucosum]
MSNLGIRLKEDMSNLWIHLKVSAHASRDGASVLDLVPLFGEINMDVDVESPSIESIPIVSKFKEVFPTNFPGMLLDRDIDFCIDLEPGTRPISIPPYRMAPVVLRKLKAQIQELRDKGFIHPSSSLWSPHVLFVKKKDGSMRM